RAGSTYQRAREVCAYCTVIRTSFDTPLTPQALRPRTRTKYEPGPTLVATKRFEALPVSITVTSAPPGFDPASSTYDAAPAVASHPSVTVEPLTSNASPPGAAGDVSHGAIDPAVPPTTPSFEGALDPASLAARTRTK